MKSKNLFFYEGDDAIHCKQIALSGERTVIVKDANSKFIVEHVKDIEINSRDNDGVTIKLKPHALFYTVNKKIAINDNGENIAVEVINSEEFMNELKEMEDKQEAQGLINYITEHVPDLYTKEKLHQKTLMELRKIKESMEDWANSY
jgi:predicted DNA-binding antitoxin AbrB/MazE fold protein